MELYSLCYSMPLLVCYAHLLISVCAMCQHLFLLGNVSHNAEENEFSKPRLSLVKAAGVFQSAEDIKGLIGGSAPGMCMMYCHSLAVMLCLNRVFHIILLQILGLYCNILFMDYIVRP